MNRDYSVTQKSIGGVPRSIFLVLPEEDQAFLMMLDRAGISLDTVFKKTIPNREPLDKSQLKFKEFDDGDYKEVRS